MKILVTNGCRALRELLIPKRWDDRREAFAPRGPPHRIKREC